MNEIKLPEVGELFADRYELQAVLGRGGMGCVYRARDTMTFRDVAVKVVRPDGERYSRDTESRFAREVEIIGNLTNRHTVTLFDSGRDRGGRLFMVFELVPGRDLAEVIEQSGPLDPEFVVHILRQVLSSLREAHDAGLLHRDLKPDNIRVFESEQDGLNVKLLDFGIARRAEIAQRITRTGELIGTPRYMSPEQLREQPLSPASDIYSLGVVTFEMLKGTEALPGHGWTDQVNRLVPDHTFTVEADDPVSAKLAGMVARMTAADPSQRYRSAAAVLADLDGVEIGPATTPRTPPLSERSRRATSRRITEAVQTIPTWMWGLLVFVTAALAFGIWSVLDHRRSTPTAVGPPPKPPEFVSGGAVDAGAATTSPSDTGPADLGRAGDPPPDAGMWSGCGEAPPFTGADTLKVQLQGPLDPPHQVTAYIPSSYDPAEPQPLVVVFHDDFIAPRGVRALGATQLGELAEREGFIIVAPDGGGPPAWITQKHHLAPRKAIEAASRRLCVDPSRIFAIGLGPGGRGAMTLTCSQPLAAIATSSFQLRDGGEVCDEFANVPYLNLAPSKDGNVPPEGGKGCSLWVKQSLAEHEAYFRGRNECGDERSEWRSIDEHVCHQWSCEAPFVSCHIDGGRGWPGAPARGFDLRGCDGEPADFPFAEAIWQFFQEAAARPSPD